MIKTRKIGLWVFVGVLLSLSGCIPYHSASPDYKAYSPGVPSPFADLPPIFDHWTIDASGQITP